MAETKNPYFNRNGELVMPVDMFSAWLRGAALVVGGPDEYLMLNYVADQFDAVVGDWCLQAMNARDSAE